MIEVGQIRCWRNIEETCFEFSKDPQSDAMRYYFIVIDKSELNCRIKYLDVGPSSEIIWRLSYIEKESMETINVKDSIEIGTFWKGHANYIYSNINYKDAYVVITKIEKINPSWCDSFDRIHFKNMRLGHTNFMRRETFLNTFLRE